MGTESDEIRIPLEQLSDDITKSISSSTEAFAVIRESVGLLIEENTTAIADYSTELKYDRESQEFTAVADDVRLRIDPFPVPGISWWQYYTAVSLIGIALILCHTLGAPLIADRALTGVILGAFAPIVVGAAYQQLARVDRSLTSDRQSE